MPIHLSVRLFICEFLNDGHSDNVRWYLVVLVRFVAIGDIEHLVMC